MLRSTKQQFEQRQNKLKKQINAVVDPQESDYKLRIKYHDVFQIFLVRKMEFELICDNKTMQIIPCFLVVKSVVFGIDDLDRGPHGERWFSG